MESREGWRWNSSLHYSDMCRGTRGTKQGEKRFTSRLDDVERCVGSYTYRLSKQNRKAPESNAVCKENEVTSC